MVEQNRDLEKTSLLVQWQAFINTMPVEETALAQRMKIMQPVIKDAQAGQVVVEVENAEIARMMSELSRRITGFLSESLQHRGLSIQFAVAEPKPQALKPFNKRDQLRHFCKLNPALITLGKEFKLELT